MITRVASATVYSAGSQNPKTGKLTYGIYSHSNTARNLSGPVANAKEVNIAELVGILQALNQSYSHEDRIIMIHTTSPYTLGVLQGHGPHTEKSSEVLSLIKRIHAYGGNVTVKKVAVGNFGSNKAFELATSAV